MLWFDRHRRLRDQLSIYIDGELDAPAVERLEAHLAECGSCRAELEQLRATVAALRDLPEAEAPRSFTLTPEQAAVRRAPLPVAPLAFGMRVAAAGVAVALAAVLMVDLGNFGGDGVSQDAAAPQMLTERNADEDGMEAGAEAGVEAPAVEDMPAPATPEIADSEPDLLPDLNADETPAGDDSGEGFMPEAEIADTPAAGPEVAEAPAAAGGGGIDALTAAEIGLAAALGLLVAGGLALAFAARKR